MDLPEHRQGELYDMAKVRFERMALQEMEMTFVPLGLPRTDMNVSTCSRLFHIYSLAIFSLFC